MRLIIDSADFISIAVGGDERVHDLTIRNRGGGGMARPHRGARFGASPPPKLEYDPGVFEPLVFCCPPQVLTLGGG